MTQILVALVLLALGARAAAEASPERPAPRDFLQPPPPAAGHAPAASVGQARAAPEEPSIAQRVARWFFSSDAVGAPSQEIQERKPQHGPPQHGPPGSSYGPPRPPKSLHSYGPPSKGHGPPSDYGPPKHPSSHYGPPKPVPLPGGSHRRPSGRYGPPKPGPHHGPTSPGHQGPPSGHHGPPSNNYGPPSVHHGPPPGHHGPPPSHHGPPPGHHGPPPPHHGGPPSSHHPPPASHHGPPPSHHGPPSGQYGPPKTPASQYGPPGGNRSPPGHSKNRDCNPCNKVPWIPMSRTPAGVSDQVLSLVTPPEAHGGNSGHYLPPAPGPAPGIPPFAPLKDPAESYGSPAGEHREPEGQYTAPAAHGELPLSGANGQVGGSAPEDDYGPPPAPPAPANPEISGPLSDDYGPPPLPPLLQAPNSPHSEYSPPAQLQPPSAPALAAPALPSVVVAPSFVPQPPIHNARPFHGPGVADYLTPPGGPFPQTNPLPPPFAPSGPASHPSGHGGDLDVVKSVTVYESQGGGHEQHVGDAYNANSGAVHLVPEDSHGGADQLHSPSGDNDQEPPGPDAGNHVSQDGQTQQPNSSDDGLEVIKSVRVADFLSSVEYPPEVVQSPYIDLTPPPSSNKEQYSNSFNHAYNNNHSPHEEIIVGRPAHNNGDDVRSSFQASATNNLLPVNHIDSHHGTATDTLGNIHNDSKSLSHQFQSLSTNHFNSDQKSSSTNKDVISGPSGPSHTSLVHDSNILGNNVYNGASLSGSIIRNEGHPSQGISNVTSSTISPLEHHSQSQDQIHVINGNENRVPSQHLDHPAPTGSSNAPPALQGTPPSAQIIQGTQGTQSSVIVDIQPSLQTAAQGASLIYQINGLNTPPAPFQHPFPNTPAQTSVFVSFQHAPQKPFNYAPPTLLNQQLPPPAPFQSTFQQPAAPGAAFAAFHTPPPPLAFPVGFPPEAPATYLNPPRHPFKPFGAPTPAAEAPPAAESQQRPAWASTNGLAAPPPTKPESDSAYLAGLLPPPPPRSQSNPVAAASNDAKRTKQIQIIVPYTSSKDLIQFRFPGVKPSDLDATGWSPIANPEPNSNQGRNVPGANNCSDIIADGGSIDSTLWQEQVSRCRTQASVAQGIDSQDDYHLHQESRRVTAKAPLNDKLPSNHKSKPFLIKPDPHTGEVQHIFASNIRDLLRGEEEAKPTVDSINLLKLQKNIDEWTQLEFSKHKHLEGNHKSTEYDKGLTTSYATGTTLHHLRLPSKKIPEEYLTTTPISLDDSIQTEQFSPTFPSSINHNDISRTSPSSLFFDHEVSGSNTHAITTNVDQESENRTKNDAWTKHPKDGSWKFFESNLVLPEAVTVTTTQQPTTTEEYTESTTDNTEPTVQANWDHLEVSISPITKEKVYVVTPLPTWAAAPPSPASVSPTPSVPRFTSSGVYQSVSRGSTTPRPSPTSINDIIPFRKSVLSPADMLGVTPLPFHSPRFLIRPTPGPSLHRLFTMRASEAGYAIPSPAPAREDVEEEESEHEVTEDNSIREYNFPHENEDAEASTAGPENSTTALKNRSAAALLGLTDLPTYTPPDGARVQTYSGHSKVVTVVTPPTIVTTRKKPAGVTEKKTSTTTTVKSSTPSPSGSPPPPPPTPVVDARATRTEDLLWHFPELLSDGDELRDEDVAAVRKAALDLQKEKRA